MTTLTCATDLPSHLGHAARHFGRITRHYAFFHILFFTLASLELITLLLFFSYLTQTTLLALTLAALFFTAFSYLVLLFYLQGKKPQQFLALKEQFVRQCEPLVSDIQGLSEELRALLSLLDGLEFRYYSVSPALPTLSLLMQKFSAWAHWKDLFAMRKILWTEIARLQVEAIKRAPTAAAGHAHLAETYVSLARLYLAPVVSEDVPWISPEYHSQEMRAQFEKCAHAALESLKIVDAYAPDDPWTHFQRAQLYRLLGQSEEEIAAYESLKRLAPEDADLLVTLGALYFAHGKSARGFSLYAELCALDEAKAAVLIERYEVLV